MECLAGELSRVFFFRFVRVPINSVNILLNKQLRYGGVLAFVPHTNLRPVDSANVAALSVGVRSSPKRWTAPTDRN